MHLKAHESERVKHMKTKIEDDEDSREVLKQILILNKEKCTEKNTIFYALYSDAIFILHQLIIEQIDKMSSRSTRMIVKSKVMTDYIEIIENITMNLLSYNTVFDNDTIRHLINEELLKRV